MFKRIFLGGLFLTAVMAMVAWAGKGPPAPDAIWGDGQLFRTVDTGNSLPNHGPKDGIFAFTNLDGQHSVAEAKPGDQDYNGGRWQVYFVAFTDAGLDEFDPDGDGVANYELTSWEEVQDAMTAGYVEQTGMGPSFVCPMIP